METNEQEVRTEIAEEKETAPKKKWGKRMWVVAGIGVVGVVIASVVLLWAVRKPQQQTPRQTAEELEQLKYDSEQRSREKQKADQLRDQAFLMRKEDDNQAQLNRLLKDLEIGKDPASGLPMPIPDQQARSEEEAIAHVLRASGPARSNPQSAPQRRKAAQPVQAPTSSDLTTNPMFVYSRNFGGAKYVDKPPKETARQPQLASGESSIRTTADKSDNPPEGIRSAEQVAEEKVHLIYTDHAPVILYEGEMLEAVLVNRIIADTEPSPVVCQLSKDVFDHTARYVVFPATSRIVGLSQVVNYKGANRLFITFDRIILPNGPSIDLPSNRKALKALDETGALGVVSKVDRHWFLQFGTAIFFGVLDGISGAAQRNRDVFSAQSAILGKTSESFDRILENIMAQYSTVVSTIRVDQGKTMKIYLSDDILVSPYAKISERSYYANH